ncbi:slit homolog 2 protein-like [Lytechinus variegatus]|uniref:slit homolog 2 protein-like n=1 Tax=Lytechinus variegatus TaxID=7654 RepID=UPI001BB0E733|nr:slit homolog 2 protein-like [Lytechinus variegatus]
MKMDFKPMMSFLSVLLICWSNVFTSSVVSHEMTCSDGLGLNYTLPMFPECKEKLHPNGTMVQTIPKLIRFPSRSECQRRKDRLGIPHGHRLCRFPDCESNPCQNGWCEETMEGYECHCPDEFQGKHCDERSQVSTTTPPTSNKGIFCKSHDYPHFTTFLILLTFSWEIDQKMGPYRELMILVLTVVLL